MFDESDCINLVIENPKVKKFFLFKVSRYSCFFDRL